MKSAQMVKHRGDIQIKTSSQICKWKGHEQIGILLKTMWFSNWEVIPDNKAMWR